MSSPNYSFWVDEGEGMAGDYKPEGRRKDDFLVGVISIGVGKNPNIGYGDGIRIFLRGGTDIASIAKAFRDIAEAIEQTMFQSASASGRPFTFKDLPGLPLPVAAVEESTGMTLGLIDDE